MLTRLHAVTLTRRSPTRRSPTRRTPTRRTMARLVAVLLLSASISSGPVTAHSPLASMSPGDGAEVSAPHQIEMTFKGVARLVRFDLVPVDSGDAVDLGKDHLFASAKTHNIAVPDLAPGAYQASWRAMAEDGHVMKGKFTFTILAE